MKLTPTPGRRPLREQAVAWKNCNKFQPKVNCENTQERIMSKKMNEDPRADPAESESIGQAASQT
jgi:hypothetical protein